ncbi:hypothetical protein BJ912DRAFT_990279 [Pholiota molesta]|nr:hypothetical protein BJ912DRAFT_990279 [Pholiota molesta]
MTLSYLVVFCYVPLLTEPGYGDNMLTTVHISADTLSLRSYTLTSPLPSCCLASPPSRIVIRSALRSAPEDAHSNMPRHSTSLNTPLTSATSSAHLARWQHQSHGHNTRPVRYIQHITWAATNVVPPLRTPLPRCENGLDTNAIRMHTPCLRRPYDERNMPAGYLEDVGAHTASVMHSDGTDKPMAREGGPWAHRHQAARPAGTSQTTQRRRNDLLQPRTLSAIRRPARYSDTGAQSAMRRRRR